MKDLGATAANKMSPKLPAMNMNHTHHKWGDHGEVYLRGMVRVKVIRLVGKLKECDACGAVKAKAAPITKSMESDKKSKDVGEKLFVDIMGPFPLTVTK